MRQPQVIIAGLGLAAVAAADGVTAASAGGSRATSAPPPPAARLPQAQVRRRPYAPHRRPSQARPRPYWVNARGLPLYFHRPDTATRSVVTGGLAGLGRR